MYDSPKGPRLRNLPAILAGIAVALATLACEQGAPEQGDSMLAQSDKALVKCGPMVTQAWRNSTEVQRALAEVDSLELQFVTIVDGTIATLQQVRDLESMDAFQVSRQVDWVAKLGKSSAAKVVGTELPVGIRCIALKDGAAAAAARARSE